MKPTGNHRPLRVLFVLSIAKADGGAARVWLNLIDGLRSRGVEPYAVLPSGGDGTLAAALADREVPFEQFLYTWWTVPDSTPASPMRRVRRAGGRMIDQRAERHVEKLIGVWGIDLVYICDGTISCGFFAAGRCDVPVVWHFHEFARGGAGGMRFADAESRVASMLRNADAIITVTHALRDDLRHRFPLDPTRVRAVYNGIPSELVADKGGVLAEGSDAVFTLAGRIDANKGQICAVDAFCRMAATFPQAKLRIVGTGDPDIANALHRRAAASPAGERIEFCGYRSDMQRVWEETDVALNCSFEEGCSMTIAESMSSGCLVLASTAESNVELMREPARGGSIPRGRHGLLYERGDAEALARQMEWVLEHPDEARSIAARGKAFARAAFSMERQLDAVRAVFDEVTR